jgi:hypothetical protein
MPVIPATQEAETEGPRFKGKPKLYLRNKPIFKNDWGVAQVVECLCRKCEALSSTPIPQKLIQIKITLDV